MFRLLMIFLLSVMVSLVQANSYVALSVSNLSKTPHVGIAYSEVMLKVTNINTFSLPLQYVYDKGFPAGFTVTSNTCSDNVLTPNGTETDSCVITGNFTPTTAGTNTWSLKIAAYGREFLQSYSTSLPVDTAAAILNLAWTKPLPTTSNVGADVGPIELTISNTGDLAATFASTPIEWDRVDTVDFINPNTTCAATLAPGKSCTYTFDFKPLSTGDKSLAATVFYDAGKILPSTTTSSVAHNATVTSAWTTNLPAIATVGEDTGDAVITFTNNSGYTAYDFAVNTTDVDQGDFSSKKTTCSTDLKTGESCTYTLKFKPQTIGTKYVIARATFAGNGVVEDDRSKNSTVTGTVALKAVWSPDLPLHSIVNYTNQQVAATYTNAGTATITAFSPTIDISTADMTYLSRSPESCPEPGQEQASFAPGASCTYTFTFEPSTAGNKTAIANATFNGGSTLNISSTTSQAVRDKSPFLFTNTPTPVDSSAGFILHYSTNPVKEGDVLLRYVLHNISSEPWKYSIVLPSGVTMWQAKGDQFCYNAYAGLEPGRTCNLMLLVTTGTAGKVTQSFDVHICHKQGGDGVCPDAATDPTGLHESYTYTGVAGDIVTHRYDQNSANYKLFTDAPASVISIDRNGDYIYLSTAQGDVGVAPVNTDTGQVTGDWQQISFASLNTELSHILINNDQIYAASIAKSGATDNGFRVAPLTNHIPPAASSWTTSLAGNNLWGFALAPITTPNYLIVGHNQKSEVDGVKLAGGTPTGNATVYNLETDHVFPNTAVSQVLIANSHVYVATRGAGIFIAAIDSDGNINIDSWDRYWGNSGEGSPGWIQTNSANVVNQIAIKNNFIYVATDDGLGFAPLDSNGIPSSRWYFYSMATASKIGFSLDSNIVNQVSTDSGDNYLYIGTSKGFDIATTDSQGFIDSLSYYNSGESSILGVGTMLIYGDGKTNSGFYISPNSLNDVSTGANSTYLQQGTLP